MNIVTKLVGVTFKPAKQNIQALKVGMVLDLKSYRFEMHGKVDENAVMVLNKEDQVGHIARDINEKFHDNATQCRVTKLIRKDSNGFTDDESAPVVSVEIMADVDITEEPTHIKPLETPEMLTSFNEKGVVVEFYPVAHQYWIGDRRMESVTRCKGTMYKPFLSKLISGNCVKSYHLEQKEILGMWDLNGNCASSIGSGFHGYMEIHQNFRSRINPEKIEKTLPKIKAFRDVVTSFPWTDDLVHTEVLVTDVKAGLCGLIDRDVEINNVHRIEDYKFNAEWDVKDNKHKNLLFPALPHTKLSGYLVQESIYADMEERAGLIVDDEVVAHIWDGTPDPSLGDDATDEEISKSMWNHISMARIKGIVDIIMESRKGA